MYHGDCVNFWRDVNKAGVLARLSCCRAVDGSTTPADIAHAFRRTFVDRYNADFVITDKLMYWLYKNKNK